MILPTSTVQPRITINADSLKTHQQVHALMISLVPLLGTLAAIVIALQSPPSLAIVVAFVLLWALTVIGIEVGFHRYFSHNAFKTNTIVRATLAIIGQIACQGPVIYWVANHRRHHQYSDRPGDLHSPYVSGEQPLGKIEGLWHAHQQWIFTHEITNTSLFAKDLLRDPMIFKINQLYFVWVFLGIFIPTLLGGLLTRTWMGFLEGFLWLGLMRIFVAQQVTFAVNSICHVYGSRPFETSEHSTNSLWLAIPTVGSSWHNNHHAFPHSARLGLEWWQIDLSYLTLWLLERVGLVWDVKTPTAEMIQAKKIVHP